MFLFTWQQTSKAQLTVKNMKTLVLKEVISIPFNKNLPQREKLPEEDKRQTGVRRSQK
jgi:hypothetical protein